MDYSLNSIKSISTVITAIHFAINIHESQKSRTIRLTFKAPHTNNAISTQLDHSKLHASRWARAIALLFACLSSNLTLGQSTPTHPYRTPQAIALTSQLQSIATDAGSTIDLPLLDWLSSSNARDLVPIWLDRRIPSDVTLKLTIPENTTVESLIHSLANHLHAEVAIVDRWVAITPKETATAMEWAYWSNFLAPNPTLRSPLKDGISWSDGTDTKTIWNSFLKSSRLPTPSSSTMLETTPDIWRAFQLQQTNPAAIATLLLSGFDQQLLVTPNDPPTITTLLESFANQPNPPNVKFQYSSEIPKIGKTAWQAWRERWPNASVQRIAEPKPGNANEAWHILAPVAAHRELVSSLAPPPKKRNPTTNNPASRRFSGRYRGETLRILENLSQQLGLELDANKLPEHLARREIDISFQNLSLEELLQKLSQACELQLNANSKTLAATPKLP